jgi:hypothetical protein
VDADLVFRRQGRMEPAPAAIQPDAEAVRRVSRGEFGYAPR